VFVFIKPFKHFISEYHYQQIPPHNTKTNLFYHLSTDDLKGDFFFLVCSTQFSTYYVQPNFIPFVFHHVFNHLCNTRFSTFWFSPIFLPFVLHPTSYTLCSTQSSTFRVPSNNFLPFHFLLLLLHPIFNLLCSIQFSTFCVSPNFVPFVLHLRPVRP